ncbi:MAG: hypothetical protein MJZ60_03270 [Bacteroidaceae bacterium]|nr:hypothetical protein [Bacteroidaceae bacterium]
MEKKTYIEPSLLFRTIANENAFMKESHDFGLGYENIGDINKDEEFTDHWDVKEFDFWD